MSQKIQKWFYNHYICPKRQYFKFTRKWSSRNAYFHLNRDTVYERIMYDSGVEPGHPLFLGALQLAITALWNEQPQENQDDYTKAAKEWSEDGPPPHIQSR
jgi:hypothetical protein